MKGMSLVEISIVLTVLLVIFGAVFLFFTSGTETVEFSRRQQQMMTDGRMSLDRVTNEIIWAGYMPSGGWSNDDWHPVVLGLSGQTEFYADYGGNRVLENTDYRLISVDNEMFRVEDRMGNVYFTGNSITSMDFAYLDETGAVLVEPLSALDRDAVRHFRIAIDMTGTWMDNVHQIQLHTTISPRNLGINHNIDPSFFPPDPLEGTVVFNVDGAGLDAEHLPTVDELLMINRMLFWGLTVIVLNDDEMGIYDYVGEQIDLVILRYRESAAAPNVYPHGDNFPVPVVTLNARDARDIWSFGTDIADLQSDLLTAANDWHPVNEGLPLPDSSYNVYVPGSGAYQSVIYNLDMSAAMDTIVTYYASTDSLDPYSGVCVINEDSLSMRRIHFSCFDASEYTEDCGWTIFRNIIEWNVGQPPPQEIIQEEGFEDPEDYNSTEPGYGEDTYSHLDAPGVSIPPDTGATAVTSPVLSFTQCYWTRNRKCGGYMDISTDSTSWSQIPDSLFLIYGYDFLSHLFYPGGGGRMIFCDKSPGYSPVSPYMTPEMVDLSDYSGQTVYIRWVFGVEDKAANNQDGWIVDDLEVLGVEVATGDTLKLDTWLPYPRHWAHEEFPTYNDDWWYLDVHTVDPIYPFEIGYAWTTWGEIGYIGPWTHGGTNDSWEIGVTAFYIPPDPMPTSSCGAHYVGTDLTQDDGFYNDDEQSWLLSEAYGGLDTLDIFEDIFLKIYRCNRYQTLDYGRIFLGFTPDSVPPSRDTLFTDNWVQVREYDGDNMVFWEWEVMEVSDEFDSARIHPDSLKYYHILFWMDSGPSFTRGGWNLDNISIIGEYF